MAVDLQTVTLVVIGTVLVSIGDALLFGLRQKYPNEKGS